MFVSFFGVKKKKSGYNELVTALQHLQGQLNKHGLASLAGRVTNVQSLLLGPVVARALHIRSAVLQRRRPRTQNAIRTDAKALAKEVSILNSILNSISTSILSLSFGRRPLPPFRCIFIDA